MQDDIHECNDSVHCPRICVKTHTIGTLNVDSNNIHSFQIENCGNNNKSRFFCCLSVLLSPSGRRLASVRTVGDPSIDDGSCSLESGRYTYSPTLSHKTL